MFVRDAMLEHALTTTPDETLESLMPRLLASRQATSAVLDENGGLIGLVGIHDILGLLIPTYVDMQQKLLAIMHSSYAEEHAPLLKKTRVRDMMVTELDVVAPSDTLIFAIGLIVQNHRKTLPVVEEGKFLGMITRRTLLERIFTPAS